MMTGVEQDWVDSLYHEFPRVEEDFHTALDEDLQPRGPDVLYELVDGLGLAPGSIVADVGCGEGRHAFRLAERFGFEVIGIDPVPRHVEHAAAELAARPADIRTRVR